LSALAAIDIGTNSVRLLVTDEAGLELERVMRMTRLGQGVDVTGELAPEAIARTVTVLADYAARMRALGVTRVTAPPSSTQQSKHSARDQSC